MTLKEESLKQGFFFLHFTKGTKHGRKYAGHILTVLDFLVCHIMFSFYQEYSRLRGALSFVKDGAVFLP